MIHQTRVRYVAFAAAVGSLCMSCPGHAQSVEDFYRGKTVNLMIGYSVGGGYDLYGRLVSRHIGKSSGFAASRRYFSPASVS